MILCLIAEHIAEHIAEKREFGHDLAVKYSPTHSKTRSPFRPDRRILLSAALLFLTFEPLHFWWLATVALVPWLHLVAHAKTRKEAFIQSLWLCFLFSAVTFSWVAYVVHTFGGLPWPLAALLLALFSLIGQPQFYLAAIPLHSALSRISGPSHGQSPSSLRILGLGATVAFFYAGLDWCLPKLFVDTLGHSLIYATNLRQAADIGGPSLLTFLLLLPNVAIYALYTRLKNRGEPAVGSAIRSVFPLLLLSVLVIASADRYGAFRNRQIDARLAAPLKKVQVAAIQANIGDIEKLSSERGLHEATARVMRVYYDLSDEALKLTPKPQVILWPETAYPSTFRSPETSDDFGRDKEMEGWTTSRKMPIVFGGYDRDLRGLSYNAVFYLNPDGTDSRYAKTVLIPFGEYIPGVDLFPMLRTLFPMVGFFGHGPGSVIREIAGLKTQPVICYEILFPEFTRNAVIQGAEVLFNFTNDSWFGPIGAPYYHLNLATFRSIETRVPQVRVTNTGFSTLILPNGEQTSKSKLFTPEIVNVTVPVIEPVPTLMLIWGDWFAKVALVIGACSLVGVAGWERRRRRA
ncbi:MAG: apolipoprotein N-acyltransferase [Cryobacterium sp.]|nr:apolipoprotein N-acyltransferase [Oligoflexia bacterium]